MGDTSHRAAHGARVYRITPWPVRILVPFIVATVILGLLSGGAAVAVPLPLLLGGLYLYAAERCGLYVTDSAIESKMTRGANSFRYPWTEVAGFEVIDSGAQSAIVLVLRNGTRRILPSTQAWVWDNPRVRRIYTQLEEERMSVEPQLRTD